jgi:hypothetical protein
MVPSPDGGNRLFLGFTVKNDRASAAIAKQAPEAERIGLVVLRFTATEALMLHIEPDILLLHADRRQVGIR